MYISSTNVMGTSKRKNEQNEHTIKHNQQCVKKRSVHLVTLLRSNITIDIVCVFAVEVNSFRFFFSLSKTTPNTFVFQVLSVTNGVFWWRPKNETKNQYKHTRRFTYTCQSLFDGSHENEERKGKNKRLSNCSSCRASSLSV